MRSKIEDLLVVLFALAFCVGLVVLGVLKMLDTYEMGGGSLKCFFRSCVEVVPPSR